MILSDLTTSILKAGNREERNLLAASERPTTQQSADREDLHGYSTFDLHDPVPPQGYNVTGKENTCPKQSN